MLQRLVFLAAFVVYLESETLVTREAVTEILGSECPQACLPAGPAEVLAGGGGLSIYGNK